MEATYLLLAYWVLCLIAPLYVGFGSYRVIDDLIQILRANPNAELSSQSFLFLATGLTLVIIRLITVIYSIRLYRHFGEGLKNLGTTIRPFFELTLKL